MPPRSRKRFQGNLAQPVPIPPEAINRAVEILQDGRLHRYGETCDGGDEVASFEHEFATLIGARYAVAVNSGGCALFLALKAAGIAPGDGVLTNSFTLAPVPGSIVHASATPLLVETTRALTIDLDDLERKVREGSARCLLLSHMRGHIADLERISALCQHFGVILIEDCAHTLGATWNDRPTGRFGRVACFSTQSYKHLNAGEGGVLTTDDPEIAARTTILSGSYMYYGMHGAGPPPEQFVDARFEMPNFSMRMTELAAAILRPQLAQLPEWCESWNRSYRILEGRINDLPHLEVPHRAPGEGFVGSSIQFAVVGLSSNAIERLVVEADGHGVHLKWFGAAEPAGYTSRYDSWRYIGADVPLPVTDLILDGLCDMRIPVGLTDQDCELITDVLGEALDVATAAA